MALSVLHLLLCLFSLIIFTLSAAIASATAATITVPLSAFTKSHTSSDPYQILKSLTSSSLSRAHHLKTRTKSENQTIYDSKSLVKSPLFAHSYGGYSIALSFGTPPQKIPFIFDTGSSLVWFPCTSRYRCFDCAFPNVDPTKIPTFIPKLSSSSKIIGCENPKCTWLFGPNVKSQCQNCDPKKQTCTKSCPPYLLQYGLGATAGRLLSESLVFPGKTVADFFVGCSIISNRQPAGIAGFGRGAESLPSQMGLHKFSYCLLSRQFDETPVSSNLVLDTGSGTGATKTPGVSYTPFRKNPVAGNAAFKEYYYLTLRKITVGNKHVKIPCRYLVPGSDGNGGTIVDSGSTFTFMEGPVFEPVAKEFIKQMGNYSRAADVEGRTGLSPCFSAASSKSFLIPELIFHFKGGAKMALPVENYFAFIGSKGVVCLILASDSGGPSISGGPAIILGSFQEQNYYVEYDLANKRFGFAKRKCAEA